MRFNDGKTRLGERGIVDRFENSSWSTKNWSSVVGVRMDTWSCSGEFQWPPSAVAYCGHAIHNINDSNGGGDNDTPC